MSEQKTNRPMAKKSIRRRKIPIKLKLYICLWLVLVLAFSFATILKLDQLQGFEREKLEIAAQIESQKATNIGLERELEFYGTDTYVERVARDELGLVTPNETVFYNATN